MPEMRFLPIQWMRFLLLAAIMAAPSWISAGTLTLSAVLVDSQSHPLTIDTPAPAFSWKMESPTRGTRQNAYQITVRETPSTPEAKASTVWDSGRVESTLSAHIRYAGKPLKSNRDYEWTVESWDNHGQTASLSSTFSTALLSPADWKSQWISAADSVPGLLLRHEFTLRDKPVRARAFASGVGWFELRVNGTKAGNEVLVPGRTPYEKLVLYTVTDITGLLQKGPNAVGVMLGNGWYNIAKKYEGWREKKYGAPRALVQIQVDYADGSSETIGSNESWTSTAGPITSDCVYDGESFDARRLPAGWDCPGLATTSDWKPASIVPAPCETLRAERVPNRIVQTLPAIKHQSPKPGVYVFDFGQNFSGWARLRVKGKAGDTVTLHYGEEINPDGSLNAKTNRSAQSTDTYILRGEGVEIYEPHFTSHGFRYVEVTGYPGTPELADLTGCLVQSDCPAVGEFTCGNELINRIHHNTVWSQRSNMQCGVQIDCPQRDERLGWLADAHVTVDEALSNFDMSAFYTKWLRDMQSAQRADGAIPYVVPRKDSGHSVDWSAGYLIIAWSAYLHTGDTQLLEEHYGSFGRYLDYLTKTAKGALLPPTRYGDWCSVAQIDAQKSGWVRGSPQLTATGYYYYCAALMEKIATALGKPDDAKRYGVLKDQIGTAFHAKYFEPAVGAYQSEPYAFQFAQTFPLFLGLIPQAERQGVLDKLIDDLMVKNSGHNQMGLLGTRYLPDVLDAAGKPDLTYAVVTQPSFPSWNSLTANRTTLTERWDGGGSGNHILFGSIDAWFYKRLAGIDVDETKPGYQRVIVRPFVPRDLDHASATIETIKGRVSAGWKKENGKLVLFAHIPANSEALVYVPGLPADSIKEGNKPVAQAEGVTFVRQEAENAVFLIGSGSYQFSN